LVLAVIALLVAAVACGGTDKVAGGAVQRDDAVSPGDFIDYEGPQTPKDTEWLLQSLNGGDAAEGSDITLYHDRQRIGKELGVEGGCMGFYIVHELEGERIRVVKPGLQVGRLDCGKPEEVRRQAESILGIMRDLEQIRATEDRFELQSESGRVAAFVPPAPAQVDPALVGTEWLLTSLKGEGLLPKTGVTLEIGKEVLGGNSGCNFYGSEVDRMDDGSLVWSGGYGSGTDTTTIGCEGDILRQETSYQNAFDDVREYRVEGVRLEMMDGDGRMTLVFQQEVQWQSDPADLVGTSWVLRSTAGEEPLEGSVPTVRFESEKEISWYDGCQNFEGRYSATENDLTVPSFGVADGYCMKPGVYGEPGERCVIGCFGPEGDYRLRDGLLEIRSEAGETTSILEPMGEEPPQKGKRWELRYLVENGAKTPILGGAPITLTFDRGMLLREGVAFGSTGCNDYRAAYEYPTRHNTFERIVVDDPVSTRRACPKSQRLAAQEQRFLAAVGDLGEYPSVSMPGQLELETRDGRSLIFAAPE
jgi:heat shock protein HslJ